MTETTMPAACDSPAPADDEELDFLRDEVVRLGAHVRGLDAELDWAIEQRDRLLAACKDMKQYIDKRMRGLLTDWHGWQGSDAVDAAIAACETEGVAS